MRAGVASPTPPMNLASFTDAEWRQLQQSLRDQHATVVCEPGPLSGPRCCLHYAV
jgi:hypothetical protein